MVRPAQKTRNNSYTEQQLYGLMYGSVLIVQICVVQTVQTVSYRLLLQLTWLLVDPLPLVPAVSPLVT
jgi:hypothetical protein